MMICRIDGATRVMLAPPGMENCKPLAIKDVDLQDGEHVMVSAWEPTPVELERLNAGGRVHLWIWGLGHPPVALTVGPEL